jgi:PAS domain S-box-containing protein
MTYGVVFHDQSGKIFMVNPAAEKILGLSKEELLQDAYHPSWQMFHEDGSDLPWEDHPVAIALGTGQLVENKIIGLKSDLIEGLRWINLTAIPIIKDGETSPEFAYAMFTDITDRITVYHSLSLISLQLAEAYKQQLDEKEIIIKEVHHRIKNNLNSVEGLLEVQLNTVHHPEAVQSLQLAVGRLRSMRMIYEKLLLLNQNYHELSVKSYLEDLIDSYKALFPEDKYIRIEKRIEDYNMEVKRLFSIGVIVNELLTDVLKYSFNDRDSGVVKVNLSFKNKKGTLVIEDNGVGLPTGFELEKNTGFGLKLVRMMSEQMGGQFSIQSNQGTRSEVSFRM